MSVLPLIAAALAGQAPEDCPTLLELKGAGNSTRAQRYADCMSRPWFPVADELKKKQRQCAHARGSSEASAWVDHIAANFPGCETRIQFERN